MPRCRLNALSERYIRRGIDGKKTAAPAGIEQHPSTRESQKANVTSSSRNLVNPLLTSCVNKRKPERAHQSTDDIFWEHERETAARAAAGGDEVEEAGAVSPHLRAARRGSALWKPRVGQRARDPGPRRDPGCVLELPSRGPVQTSRDGEPLRRRANGNPALQLERRGPPGAGKRPALSLEEDELLGLRMGLRG